MLEFDKAAFREGLINAFCHRDYTVLGTVRVLIHKKQIRKDDKNEQRYFNAVKEIHPVHIVIDD